MFVTVIIGVFWRYILDNPLLWTINAATIAFIWVVMIASGPANRHNDHIQFDLIYNRVRPSVRRWMRIVGDLLIIVPFAAAIPATVDYIGFVGGNKVTGLNLTFDWAYSCVLVFLVATVLHRGRLLLLDLRGRLEDEPS
jgi:TRAP-type C4-dicarboxylate transport system permease small subunit